MAQPDAKWMVFTDDGIFPNNEKLPVLIYSQAVQLPADDPASGFEELFKSHQWKRSWRNGVYDFHHYHSTAHEVLGCFSGSASIQFGGRKGSCLDMKAGDVVVIPAGVAHKRLSATDDFAVVGAYPKGTSPDMNYGDDVERPRTDTNIVELTLPDQDPVHGMEGPLIKHWLKKP